MYCKIWKSVINSSLIYIYIYKTNTNAHAIVTRRPRLKRFLQLMFLLSFQHIHVLLLANVDIVRYGMDKDNHYTMLSIIITLGSLLYQHKKCVGYIRIYEGQTIFLQELFF
jgi:hypothetical protein